MGDESETKAIKAIAEKLCSEYAAKFEILAKIAEDSFKGTSDTTDLELWGLLYLQFDLIAETATKHASLIRETKANAGQSIKMLPKPTYLPSVKVIVDEKVPSTEVAIRAAPLLVPIKITHKPWLIKQIEKPLNLAAKLISWKKKT